MLGAGIPHKLPNGYENFALLVGHNLPDSTIPHNRKECPHFQKAESSGEIAGFEAGVARLDPGSAAD